MKVLNTLNALCPAKKPFTFLCSVAAPADNEVIVMLKKATVAGG